MKPIVFCAALLANSGAVAAQIEYLGSYVWTEPGIGGVSGVEVLSETEMIALSDRGTLVTITTGRTDAGKIDAITGYNSVLLSPDAGPFDSEGLAIDPAGGAWLSFEGLHGSARYRIAENSSTPCRPRRVFQGCKQTQPSKPSRSTRLGIF